MSDPKTPGYSYSGYKRKQPPSKPSSTARFQKQIEFTPSKRSKPEYNVKNIEDEEFPEGYTFMETINTPGRGKSAKKDKENKNSESPPQLSLLAHYDEIIRAFEEYFEDDITAEFLEFAENQELCRIEWLKSVNECKRLQNDLEKANHEIGDYSNKLRNARKILDQEKKLRRRTEEERDALEQQMSLARDLLFNDKGYTRLPNDTLEKLAFLNNTSVRSNLDRNGVTATRLNTINEINSNELNSTGSLLSELSYSKSEDGLDVSAVIRPETWKRPKNAAPVEEASSPKRPRRSSGHKVVEINPTDKIIATTTLSVSKAGPITATSIIEAVPQEPLIPNSPIYNNKPSAPPSNEIIEQLWLNAHQNSPAKSKSVTNLTKRQHIFISKAVIRPDTCGSCSQRIRFGKIALKCKECRSLCHVECKMDLPVPCIPTMNTPTQKGVIGIIADYAPQLPPMVPALIVHCANEIELRGMNEVGLYRVPGSEKDVKMLKEKFLRSKSTPQLQEIDIHVICGVIKDFLRSLREPLITNTLWRDFIQAGDSRDIMDIAPAIYQAISLLPQPNRDTLAYIMLHLNKVAQNKDCKMPASNLAKVFGPTIVGYSAQDIDPLTLLTETRQQVAVMEHLFNIPIDFWETYVNDEQLLVTPRNKNMPDTPSTGSLRGHVGGFFTPYSAKSVQSARKRRKFFATPPSKK